MIHTALAFALCAPIVVVLLIVLGFGIALGNASARGDEQFDAQDRSRVGLSEEDVALCQARQRRRRDLTVMAGACGLTSDLRGADTPDRARPRKGDSLMGENSTAPGLTRAQEMANGLEELAAWLREHPDCPIATASARFDTEFSGLSEGANSEARERFMERARLIDGVISRDRVGYVRMKREFAGGVELSVEANQRIWGTPQPEELPMPEELRRFTVRGGDAR